ncbi:MAG: hypothetical protein M1144_02525 [Candidatus Thermoplasmatota archaeon]|jgi:hypothetical protein|nr:hypothetical protein [Candidatus Thermoplasmatota archaeon]
MPRIRSTSGGKEEQALSRARELRKDPHKLLPDLSDDCPTAQFDRLREELDRVQEDYEDSEALKRWMVKGSDIPRAYACLLYFLKERPETVTAVAHYSTGNVPFLALGPPPPEAHIAVQYYSDPRRLLLGYMKLAKGGLFGGGGLHFYAMDDRVVCSGRAGRPPARFVTLAVGRLPYRLFAMDFQGEKAMVCQHLQKGEILPHLAIGWESAQTSFRICKKCTRDDTHLLGSFLENMAVPDPQGSFTVSLEYPLEHHHKGACPLGTLPGRGSGSERDYRKGKLSDAAFLAEYARETEEAIRAVRGQCFVAGGHCYGGEATAFIEALEPTEAEKKVLDRFLPGHGTVLLVADRTAGKTLEALWKDYAIDIIRTMGADDAEAERLLQEFQSSPGRVSELVERLHRKERERVIVSALPEYEDVVAEAAFAIAVSRLYRTQGPPAVEQHLTSALPEEGKVKGLAWGFLVAIGKGVERHEWRFTDTEREFGAALATSAEKVLSAPPEGYHEALTSLLAAAGVVNWGRQTR